MFSTTFLKSFFFAYLVSASHYSRNRTQFRHQNSLTDAVTHGIEEVQPPDCRASSVQSLQTLISAQKPNPSKSYPRLQRLLTRQGSSPIPPPGSSHTILTPNRNGPVYLPTKTHPVDDAVRFVKNKSFDESIISTNLSKEATTLIIENDERETILNRSEPVEIRVRCIFSRVGEIDTLNERYTAEIFFEASWYDKDHKNISKYDPQMGLFNPQLVVLNHIGDSLRHDVNISIEFFFIETPFILL